MNILIIGGAGYLGLTLSEFLINRNYDITIFDNFTYNNMSFVKNKINVVNADVSKIEKYKELILKSDIIFYLASPRLGELHHEYQVEKSVHEFQRTLNLVHKNTRFIFASSCSVYGNTKEFVNENSETQVTSLYSKLKIECEKILLSKNNKNYKIVRLSTLYGKSKLTREDIFINQLVEDFKNGRTIKIFDPYSERPHLHVKDCAKILFSLLIEHYDKMDENIDSNKKLPTIINIGKNELNTTKKHIVDVIENVSQSNNIKVKLVDSEDSRSYSVNFNLLESICSINVRTYEEGVKEMIENETIIASLENWDSILNYYLPHTSSPTWYMNEENKPDYPKVFGFWSIFNTENNNKLFGIDIIKDIITPDFDDDIVYHTQEFLEGKKHLYIVNVWDNLFFIKNKNIGFKCISKKYIDDVKQNRCKIVMIHHFEGYSGSSNRNQDLEIINSWIQELNLPPKNVYYVHGNLLIDEVRKSKGFNFKCFPISIFDSWIDYRIVEDVIDYTPINDKNLFLTYNRQPRYHRVYLISLLMKNGLFHRGKSSLGKFEINEENPTDDPYIHQLSALTPIEIDRTLDINWATNIELSDHRETFASIVTETLIDDSVLFVSEKIWKPIILGHPFLILGNVNTLKYLKDLGFKTYDRWFDETYDQEVIHHRRVEMVVEQISKYQHKSTEELKEIREEMKDICRYNREWFLKMIREKYNCNEDMYCGNKKPILDIYKTIWKEFN